MVPVQVKEIMQQPPVIVRDDDPLERVVRAMVEDRVACVAVLDRDANLVGVIREQDLGVRQSHFPFSTEPALKLFGEWLDPATLERNYEDARARPARAVMAPPTCLIDPEARLVEALASLQHGHSLLVVRAGEPVGTLSRHDLLKLFIRS
jgi:CBS domain-containing protein